MVTKEEPNRTLLFFLLGFFLLLVFLEYLNYFSQPGDLVFVQLFFRIFFFSLQDAA